MGRVILVAGMLLVMAGAAQAQDVGTTRGEKVMCKTQQSLREILRAIDEKDRQLLRTVQGCRRSIEGVRAEVLQDNVNMLKIRVGEIDEKDRDEFWVLPDTVKLGGRR
jgi:uncharacterized protein YlxW (UPF0749 family)